MPPNTKHRPHEIRCGLEFGPKIENRKSFPKFALYPAKSDLGLL